MTTIVVVPHRLPLNVEFYIFVQQIHVLNILNMVYNLNFFLFKTQFTTVCTTNYNLIHWHDLPQM